MAGDPKNPVIGTFAVDGVEFEEYAEDLPPGGCLGLVPTRDGFMDASNELLANHAQYGAKAGIPDADVASLALANERIARIDVFLPVYLKAAEVLTETRAKLDDQRQRIILDSATSVDRRAPRNPEVLAKYQKTREYRSAIAKKAMKTRAKNAAEAEAANEPEEATEEPNEAEAPSGADTPKVTDTTQTPATP